MRSPITCLALLLLALPAWAGLEGNMAEGPLLACGPKAPPGVCSAFQVATPQGPRLVTARHCLHGLHPRAWLPGLVGSALKPEESQWTQLRAIGAQSWNPWPGAPHAADLAWVDGWPGSPALVQGPFPRLGQPLIIRGYPGGRGPTAWSCVFAGVVVLRGDTPRVRPSLRCPGDLPASLHGLSGGPVLDGQGRVVGVLVSGTRVGGSMLPGFEPLSASWLPDGRSTHALVTDDGPPRHRLEVRMDDRVLSAYRVLSPTGVAWSWWPTDAARHRLAAPVQP